MFFQTQSMERNVLPYSFFAFIFPEANYSDLHKAHEDVVCSRDNLLLDGVNELFCSEWRYLPNSDKY